MTENDIERQCLDVLRLRGYWITRAHAGTFKSVDGRRWIKGAEKGTPDYTVTHEYYPGFLLETKRPGETCSPEQVLKISEIQMGYRLAVAVVDSAEMLLAWIAEHELKARERWRERL